MGEKIRIKKVTVRQIRGNSINVDPEQQTIDIAEPSNDGGDDDNPSGNQPDTPTENPPS